MNATAEVFKMVPIKSIGVKILLLQALVVSVASKALEDGDKDELVDPDELTHFSLPSSPNSTLLLEWDEWDTWEASDDIKKSFQYYRSGYDEDGLVVYVANFGKCRYRELVQKPQAKIDEFWKLHEQLMRRAEADGAKDNNKGIVFIVDMEGFSLANFASSKALKFALKYFISLLELNHVCRYGFIINANFAAESFLALAKPFIGTFLEKFEIYGTRSEKWKPKLFRKIPASQLPPALGGSVDWKALPDQVTKS